MREAGGGARVSFGVGGGELRGRVFGAERVRGGDGEAKISGLTCLHGDTVKPSALRFVGLLGAILLFASACGGDKAAPTATPTPAISGLPILDLASAGDKLRFGKDMLTVEAGAEVVVRFRNASSVFQHNWVLVQDGTKDDVAKDGLEAGIGDDYVRPGDQRVVANSRLLGPGQTEEVRFTAPSVGTYQFVCTFPGHNATMFGAFEVTP